ncbi:MAG: WD40 repeat domain-containing protein [Coxiellaceae bacterium]|nr:MAG: WD40 repeat domain-containing protein [Coxiellaceae bacterium]
MPKATPEEIYNELPNFLDRWDFYNFCSFILVYSIFPPEDGKADNYCLRLHYDPTGKISHFELIGFDEDQRTTHKINFRNNKHYPLFKCLLFAFEKMMRRRFDPQLRERFLQIAKLILLRWLADLKRQNDLYQKLIYSGILNVNDLLEQNFELNTEGQEASLLDVPIKLDPDDVPFMLARIHRITEVLQNPDISCWDLFRATEPLLAEFYQWAMQCANNNIMQIQTILFCGDSSFESTFAEKYSATPELASQQQLELERYTLSIDDLESRRTETVSSAAIKLIQLMNFDDYQAESPELWEILQLIAGYFPFIAAPKINQTLLDELLRLSLVKKAAPITGLVLQWGAVFNQPPSLAEINLKHCKAITEDALLQLIKASPQLRFLDISGCSLLSVEILAPLLQLCPLLQTLSLNQLRWKHIAIHHKTLQQIHFNECMRLQDVQLYTPKLSLLENNNCPKLKQCVIFPYSQMPRTLANSRNLAIISLTNYKDKTIKSRTLLAYNIDNTTDYIKSMECTTTGNIFTVNSAQIVYWDAHQDYKTTIIGKNLKRFTCSTYLTNGLIAIGCHDHNIYLYDPNNNTNVNPLPIATLSGHIKSISALASKDWLLISASDEDSCLRFGTYGKIS